MNDTNQLPEPELGYIQTDKSNQPAFSARQMREAMKHALQARAQVQVRVPMTDKQRLASWLGSPVDMSWAAKDAYEQGISDAEAHHDITAQAKKEGA